MIRHRKYKPQVFWLRVRLAKLFGFFFFAFVALAAFFVAIVDRFFMLPLFDGATSLVTATAVAALLIYVLLERATILEDIHDYMESSDVRHITNQASLYMSAARIMIETDFNPQGKKRLWLASLHGYTPRHPRSLEVGKEFEIFDHTMMRLIKSSDWEVKNVFNIDSIQTLDRVLKLIEQAKDVRGFEVRAFCPDQALPHTSPLIIGDHNVFFAIDDPSFYRVQEGIHVRGPNGIAFAEKYFNTLWWDARVSVLKSAVGPNAGQFDYLRKRLKAREKSET